MTRECNTGRQSLLMDIQKVDFMLVDLNLFLDTHLMLSRPMQYIEAYAKAGADLITVHVEAEDNCAETLEAIHALGVRAGVSINPETPVSALEPLLPLCDVCIRVPLQETYQIQELHLPIYHCLCLMLEEHFFDE